MEPYSATIYKPIDGYGGKYLVSPSGEIVKVGKVFRAIKPIYHRGAAYVRLTGADGRRREKKVSALVAAAFRLAPRPGMSLYHVNGMKADNHVGNLVWMDKQQLGRMTGAAATRKPVCKVDLRGAVVDVYPSARAAGRQNHMSYQAVLDRCNGKVKKPFALDGHDYRFDAQYDEEGGADNG